MPSTDLIRFLGAALVALILAQAQAEEAKPNAPAAQVKTAEESIPRLTADSVTQHTIAIGGQQLTYKATAGTLPLFGPKGEVAANVFYVAYTLDAANPRPITFAFNGGPGAAAAFLQLGALGPRIVPFSENGAEAVRPVTIADNPNSWLPFTDLVFIDPVGTGYSRATGGGTDAERAYWGVEKDADSLADFIRLYLTRSGRELAPIFLAGESYGGFRVGLLCDRLLGMGLPLKGAVMISPALEFVMLHGDDFAILPLTFALPSLTASNVEMREGSNAPLDAVHDAEAYARTNYLQHLADGLKWDDAVISALAKFTGLDREVVAKHHGRVTTSLFLEEYRRRNDRALSRYDGTVSVPLPMPAGRNHFDPILDGAVSALAPAASQYFRQELGFRTDLQYRLLNREVSGHWDFGTKPTQQGYAGSLDELTKARVRNPALKILIAHGYTDLVTPYSMSRYLVAHLLPLEGSTPISIHIYRGGHMMYLRPASRGELANDARALYESARAP
jgi:carboxypeptidase C (cathepsin A)